MQDNSARDLEWGPEIGQEREPVIGPEMEPVIGPEREPVSCPLILCSTLFGVITAAFSGVVGSGIIPQHSSTLQLAQAGALGGFLIGSLFFAYDLRYCIVYCLCESEARQANDFGVLLKGVMRYTARQTLCGLLGHIILAAFNESSMTVSQMTLCFMSGAAATVLPVRVVQGFLSVCYVRISSFNVTAAHAVRSSDPCATEVMSRNANEFSVEPPSRDAFNAGVSDEPPAATVVSAVTAHPRESDGVILTLEDSDCPDTWCAAPINSML